jgi:sec-independent protein translocase protein TatC
MTDTDGTTDSYGPQLSLFEHLNDLRKRLVWAALAIVITTGLSFAFAEGILNFLLQPYSAASLGDVGATLQTLRPTEGLETFFKVSLVSGIMLAMPVILIQFWLFVSPGLTEKERRYIYIFVPSALVLFLLGIAFAWFVLAPAAIYFLANFMPDIFKTDWTGQEYISFILRMVLWLGVSFELPIIVYFVARVGIISADMLRSQWRIAVVVVAVLAAMITPSIDPVTMLLTMAPLLVLYILSIFLARIGQRQFERSMEV